MADKDDAPKAAPKKSSGLSDESWSAIKTKFIDLMRVPGITQSTEGWNHLTGHIDELREYIEEEL